MADKRAYFKLDVGYMSNPKVLGVMDESPTAILLHVASIGYAAQHLTDGIIPVKALLRSTGATEADADLLYDAGLWLDGPSAGKAEVHDYLAHQRSAAEVKGASERAKKSAEARWDATGSDEPDANRNADRNATGMQNAMQVASETPMLREEREEREEKSFVGDAAEADPEPREDVERICDHLVAAIVENGSKRPTVTKAWRTSARLMLDKDGRTVDEVIRAIDWCQRGESKQARFWRPNVMSMPKLRDKFDQMRLQAAQDNVHHLRPPLPPEAPPGAVPLPPRQKGFWDQ